MFLAWSLGRENNAVVTVFTRRLGCVGVSVGVGLGGKS